MKEQGPSEPYRRSALELDSVAFGESVRGTPLTMIPCRDKCRLLILASIHGEEPETGICLSRAYRSLRHAELSPHIASILCANPDGIHDGTRGNARGVDLNRNFPASNWTVGPLACRWDVDDTEEVPIGAGATPASEPEIRAILDLIEKLSPDLVITLHAPLGCVDDPLSLPQSHWIATEAGIPLVSGVGYPTPGSFGSWAAENEVPLITWEFPKDSVEGLSRTQTPVLQRILSGNCWANSGL